MWGEEQQAPHPNTLVARGRRPGRHLRRTAFVAVQVSNLVLHIDRLFWARLLRTILTPGKRHRDSPAETASLPKACQERLATTRYYVKTSEEAVLTTTMRHLVRLHREDDAT